MIDPHEERRQYSLALSRVHSRRSADPDTLAAISPHLVPGRLEELLQAGQAVALPGVAVDGAYWRLACTDSGELGLTSMRTPESYLHFEPLHAKFDMPSLQSHIQYVAEALAYGRSHWGPYLLPDEFQSSARIQLRDPRGGEWGGRLITTAYAHLKTSAMNILGYPRHWRVDAFARSLYLVGTEPIEGLERVSGNPEPFYYCAVCGHYLSTYECRGCNQQFSPDPDRLTSRNLPMTPAIIDAFRMWNLGHDFETDPSVWAATYS